MKPTNKSYSFTILISFMALSLIGIVLLPLLPIKLSPTKALPCLAISYTMPECSSRVVETEVTSKLESILARVTGVQEIHSSSDNGSGTITIDFDKRTDLSVARFEVSTLIRQIWAQLPENVSYPIIETNYSDEDSKKPFLIYTLNGSMNPFEILQYADENIKPILSQIDGVDAVTLNGASSMEWNLKYDSQQLDNLGISLIDLRSAIMHYYGAEYLGIVPIDMSNDSEWIRVVLANNYKMSSLDLSQISVRSEYGKHYTLDKLLVAQQKESEQSNLFRINGQNAIYLNITTEVAANQLAVGEQVRNVLSNLVSSLPHGYNISKIYDATEYIEKELSDIYWRTGLTILILVLFVFLISWNVRYVLLITISICANLAIAVLFYYILDLELQLYSLAGITISLNLIIDNTVVMCDQMLYRHNRKVFFALLAATLTTIGSLSVIFLLDDNLRLNLIDFAGVLIINLAISLVIALFFIPALIQNINIKPEKFLYTPSVRRYICKLSQIYFAIVNFICSHKKVAVICLILSFGTPVFLLPEKLEGDGLLSKYYNNTFGTKVYKESLKPIIDKVLGGSLRLFINEVYLGSYPNTPSSEPSISVMASLPEGSTLKQMNEQMKRMEIFLNQYPEIKQFQTYIYGADRAYIRIFFTEDSQMTQFPYMLKNNIIAFSETLGGGSWSVSGLNELGYSNDVREYAGNFQIKMQGYNYDELYDWAIRLKSILMEHRRIKDVIISSNFTLYKDNYSEYYLKFQPENIAKYGINVSEIFEAIQPFFGKDFYSGRVLTDNGISNIKLSAIQYDEFDVWALLNREFSINNKIFKLMDFATLERGNVPQRIQRENQQYCICLQYEYTGEKQQGEKLLDQDLRMFNSMLPAGYAADKVDSGNEWHSEENSQYWYLLLIIAIIFFVTCILFNSIIQPLAIISTIPISFIGVFLTFYIYDLNFDYGGFASFILLCGITVNASIYILYEYNNIRKHKPTIHINRVFLRSINAKATPIFITVVSTILGFIPFLLGTSQKGFWFSLAAGSIGGLTFSMISVFFILPMFIINRKVTDCHLL